MTPPTLKRFYRQATMLEDGCVSCVLLDGKRARTPCGAELRLPNRDLGRAIVDEWNAQYDRVDHAAMKLTALAYRAIDHVAPRRAEAVEHILGFGRSDLVCYRAEQPAELASRQSFCWDWLLAWVAQKHGIRLKTGPGITPIEQSPESQVACREAILRFDNFGLAALDSATRVTGSLVVALTLAEGRLDAAQAFAASQIDEKYQAERWGSDAGAEGRASELRQNLVASERFLRLLALAGEA